MRRATLVLACLVALATLPACSSSGSSGTRVFLWGDSLVQQATPYWKQIMAKQGKWEFRTQSLAGTATCDFFREMRKAKRDFHPQLVAISYVGNALGTCMVHKDGTPFTHAEYLQHYRDDTLEVLKIFGPHVLVQLIGPPAMADGNEDVYRIYQDVAKTHSNVRFADGGSLVSPHRTWAHQLPCMKGERCVGPTVNGVRTNVMRSPDKVHFCPTTQFGKPCHEYAPGAYRFALTIAHALEADLPAVRRLSGS